MTRKVYLKQYHQWIKRFVASGVTYVRKVFWQLTRGQRQYYTVQLRAMRQAYRGMK